MNKKDREKEWIRLLKERDAFCYVKPNKHIHESGFKCFEVGYLVLNKARKVKKKLVLGEYVDLIQLYQYDSSMILPNLDQTADGYIRILAYDDNIYWWGGIIDYVFFSTAQLKLLKDTDE